MKTVLTIAGSDCSGGAGIQADIKTITAHGLYATSVITALTAQNTMGVYGIIETPPEFVSKQLNCVFEDIPPDAIKIGMVSSAFIIETIAEGIAQWKPKNIVADPVMIATSGRALLRTDAMDALLTRLLPLATIITPNLPETEAICGFAVRDRADMERAAHKIANQFGCAVLVKGGHQRDAANDVLYDQGAFTWFYGERIDNLNTHGTGCTLSSAIACGLAEGKSLVDSIQSAKKYLSGALRTGLDLGKGSGPLHHAYVF